MYALYLSCWCVLLIWPRHGGAICKGGVRLRGGEGDARILVIMHALNKSKAITTVVTTGLSLHHYYTLGDGCDMWGV